MRFLAEQQPSPDDGRAAGRAVPDAGDARICRTAAGRSEAAGCAGWPIRRCRKALSIIHSRYAEDLDVEGLAREAGVSRTVLGERFAELLGEPPMRYCARWRMRIAANMLRDGKQNTANIAYAVGFNSEAAFNRAFKREYGEPPATWRRRIEAEEQAARGRASSSSSCRRSRSAIARRRRRDSPGLFGDRRGPADRQDGELAQPYRARLGQPAVAALDRRIHARPIADPLRRAGQRPVATGTRPTCRSTPSSTTSNASSTASSWSISTCLRSARARRSRSLMPFVIPSASGGWSSATAMPLAGRSRANPAEVARREAMITLTEVGWGADNPSYRQLFTNLYIPGASPKQMGWFNEMQRMSASPENAVRLQRVLAANRRPRLAADRCRRPTLIFHSRDDQAVPFSQGEELAARNPGRDLRAARQPQPHPARNGAGLAAVRRGQPRLPQCRRGRPAGRRDDRGSKRCRRTRSARAFGGRWRADRLCRDGIRLPAGQSAELDDPPAITTDRVRSTATGSPKCSRLDRLSGPTCAGFGLSDGIRRRFDFEAMVDDLGAVIDHAASSSATCSASLTERRSRSLMPRGTRSGFASWCWSTASLAGWRVRADPEELAWREFA